MTGIAGQSFGLFYLLYMLEEQVCCTAASALHVVGDAIEALYAEGLLGAIVEAWRDCVVGTGVVSGLLYPLLF